MALIHLVELSSTVIGLLLLRLLPHSVVSTSGQVVRHRWSALARFASIQLSQSHVLARLVGLWGVALVANMQRQVLHAVLFRLQGQVALLDKRIVFFELVPRLRLQPASAVGVVDARQRHALLLELLTKQPLTSRLNKPKSLSLRASAG